MQRRGKTEMSQLMEPTEKVFARLYRHAWTIEGRYFASDDTERALTAIRRAMESGLKVTIEARP
jgi:hypothetical protein